MLKFSLDTVAIESLTNELGLTDRQTRAALSRAVRRTAGTLRKRAERELKSELDVRKVAYLRRRLKSFRLTRSGVEGARLWFGENPMFISGLRGSIKKTKDGAVFDGRAGRQEFDGGFIVKGKYGRTIMTRKGKDRLPIAEGTVPVKDQMDGLVESQLFADCLEILWANFEREMSARARFAVGVGR